jgi:hypothetical protein
VLVLHQVRTEFQTTAPNNASHVSGKQLIYEITILAKLNGFLIVVLSTSGYFLLFSQSELLIAYK